MSKLERFRHVLVLAALAMPQLLFAQATTLPAASRTVYKCVVGGKVVYTDEPCIGAERVNVEPTRGLNKSSGKELTGQDVSRERQREQLAEAMKPLTGLTPRQFEVQRGRVYLTPEAKSQCAALDRSIAETESRERFEPVETKPGVQRELFALRKRHRDLRC
jgi:hypothetical protein